MRPRRLNLCAAAFAAACTLPSLPAFAQTPKGNELTGNFAVTGVYQFDSDLDGGGRTGFASAILNAGWSRRVSQEFGVGLTLRYDYEKWRFSNPAAFGGKAPWDQLNALALGFPLDYAHAPDLRFSVTPVIEWAYETGASTSDVVNYGAVFSAMRIFSPQLVLGAGVGVFRQIDETKVFPFLVVQWQIDERWRLANPFRAGPAGGAGLELAYTVDERWEIAGGGTYRSYRFRLSDTGIAPGGIGEHRFFPLFVRATRTFGPATRLDIYAGASVGGRLSVDTAQGAAVGRDDYKAAPAIGATLLHRF